MGTTTRPDGRDGRSVRSRGVFIAWLVLCVWVTQTSCSDEVKGSLDPANSADSSAFEAFPSVDGAQPGDSSRAPQPDSFEPRMPSAVSPHVTVLSGSGTVSSPSFRLTLSVGAPVMSTVVESPSYRLKMLAPRALDPQETP